MKKKKKKKKKKLVVVISLRHKEVPSSPTFRGKTCSLGVSSLLEESFLTSLGE